MVLEKGDPVLEELEEILSRYRYHLCWDSLLGRASIEGGGSSETFWLYVGKDRDLSTLGGKDVILNERTVRIDYWGSNDGLALCQEVVACLKSAAEADAE